MNFGSKSNNDENNEHTVDLMYHKSEGGEHS